MQTADSGKSDDVSERLRLDRARDRRIAVEAHVGPVFVVVAGVPSDQVKQVALAEHDQVIGWR
jgi:hypothetical protein